MTHTRRPLSLAASLALGLGAALLVLLAGGAPVAAAPAALGGAAAPNGGNICFARNDSNTGTVYATGSAAALHSAVAAAVPGDVVRLAGTCSGVIAELGTTQTVAITRALTLVGGFTTTNWLNTFPITQPTIVDAQGLGRVITASAAITLADLTIQNGQSFGGDGGGIFAGDNLMLIGAVNILSNTTSTSTSQADGRLPSGLGTGDGGGAIVEKVAGHLRIGFFGALSIPGGDAVFQNNLAGTDGGGLNARGDAMLNNVNFVDNSAGVSGGGLNVMGTYHGNTVLYDHNNAYNGGGLYSQGGVTIQNIVFDTNHATYGGGGWAGISFQSATGSHLTFTDNSAAYGGAMDIFQLAAAISDSYFANNHASTAGGALYVLDSNSTVFNVIFQNNIAPEGGGLAAAQLFAPTPQMGIVAAALLLGIFDTREAASAAGPASTAVLTDSAFASSGVSLFITDTIVSGYALDLQTGSAPSSTIHGDYNLFDHTPVISGTHITTGTHSLVGNPLFADSLGHLSAGSPAIDHGTNVGLSLDYDGNPRPSGAGFDIGPYEFVFLKVFLPLLQR